MTEHDSQGLSRGGTVTELNGLRVILSKVWAVPARISARAESVRNELPGGQELRRQDRRLDRCCTRHRMTSPAAFVPRQQLHRALVCFWFAVPHEHRTQSYQPLQPFILCRTRSLGHSSILMLVGQLQHQHEAEGKEVLKGLPCETPLLTLPASPLINANSVTSPPRVTYTAPLNSTNATHILSPLYLTCTHKHTHSSVTFSALTCCSLHRHRNLYFNNDRTFELSKQPRLDHRVWSNAITSAQDTPPVTITRCRVWFHRSALAPCRIDGFRHRPRK